MNTAHTPGRLEVDEMPETRYALFALRASHGPSIAEVLPLPDDTPGFVNGDASANARRLVACWNALEGVPTDAIEALPSDLEAFIAALKNRKEPS
jgi:hypothetical protein